MPTLDANNIFQSQKQLVSLAQQQRENALNNALTGYDAGGENTLKLLNGLDGVATPKLSFNVNARGIWDGLMQGGANALSNHYLMAGEAKNRELQQERINIARALDMEERRRAKEKEDSIKALFNGNPQLINAWKAMSGDDTGQRLIMENIMAPTFGVYKGQGEANKALASQPGVTQSELNAKLQKLEQVRDLVLRETGVDLFGSGVNEGQIPANARNWAGVFDVKPEDRLDDMNRFLETSQNRSKAQQEAIDTQAKPTLTQQEITKNALDIKVKEADVAYASVLKQIDVLTGQNKLEEAARMKRDLETGRTLYNQAVAKYNQMTPGQVKLFNAQMKSLGLGFYLPERSENKVFKDQYGGLKIYNPDNNTVSKPDKAN